MVVLLGHQERPKQLSVDPTSNCIGGMSTFPPNHISLYDPYSDGQG